MCNSSSTAWEGYSVTTRLVPRLIRAMRRNIFVNWDGRLNDALNQPKYLISSKDDVKIWVISLDRVAFRKLKTAKSLERQGVRYEIFSAVDGLAKLNPEDVRRYAGRRKAKRLHHTRELTKEQMLEVYTEYKGGNQRSLENHVKVSLHERLRFGCYMSHVSIWRLLVQLEQPFAIILEDDVAVESDFIDKVKSALKKLPTQWGILYLNGCFRKLGPVWDDGLRVSHGGLCTSGYVLSTHAARTLLMKPSLRSEKAIDHMLDEEVLSGRLLAFHAEPTLVNLIPSMPSTLAY